MRPVEQFEAVMWLVSMGCNDCQIGRILGIPRGTIRDWRHHGRTRGPAAPRYRSYGANGSGCPLCDSAALDGRTYAYLLGLYLGDGCISAQPKGVYRLRVVLDERYPGIIAACGEAIERSFPDRRFAASYLQHEGCIEVSAYWKHWPCLFPQYGAGMKHTRKIELAAWQQDIARDHPDRLLRGLIHSDGWRGTNRVRRPVAGGVKEYEYPRYQFTNVSEDIRTIFCRACEDFGVKWRRMTWNTISIARAEDVAKLDVVVGPKA